MLTALGHPLALVQAPEAAAGGPTPEAEPNAAAQNDRAAAAAARAEADGQWAQPLGRSILEYTQA